MGSLSTFKQQYHILLQEEVDSPDPRTQTILDLQAFILQRLDQKEIFMIVIFLMGTQKMTIYILVRSSVSIQI